MEKKPFEKYYKKLALEGWLKSAVCGLIVAFSVMLVSSLVFWLIGFSYPWIAFIIAAVVLLAAAPIFFFKKFRPTARQIARRVDDLGLEERLLTMHQLQNDTSYIAMRQREDAQAALKTVSASYLKIAVSARLIIALSIALVFGSGMTTVSMLSAAGNISSGKDIIDSALEPEPVYYEVEFVEEGEGFIEGDIFQLVEAGKTIDEVVAIPDNDWYFSEWYWEIAGEQFSLAETNVFYVEDLVVNGPMTIYAIFAEAEYGEGEGGGDGEGAEGEEGEEESDEQAPQEGEEGEESENENESDNSDAPPSESEEEGDKQSGTSRYEDKNQIIDNETFYGDEYENAVEEVVGELESNEEISDDRKDIIKDYFDNIEK